MKKRLVFAVKIGIVAFATLILNFSSNKVEVKLETGVTNRIIDLSTMALKVEEDIKNDIYSAKETYSGSLTGYSADCPLCSGKLACKSSYYVQDGTDTYPDEIYGTVKIVASSANLPCGTVIRFNAPTVSSEPVVAIVLDRGVLGTDIDLLSPTEEYAYKNVGRRNISYDVLRRGW